MLDVAVRRTTAPALRSTARPRAIPAIPWPSLSLVLLAVGIPFICVSVTPLRGDIFWILRTADVMVAQGHLLTHDPFTFGGHTGLFVQAQWLAGLLYFSAYRLLGLEGVVLLNALVAATTFSLVLWLAWRRSGSLPISVLATLTALAVAISNFNPRAQTLAFPLFVATLAFLAHGGQTRRTLTALAALEVVWANVHGSFFLGPLLTTITLAGHLLQSGGPRRWRQLTNDARVRFLLAALVLQAAATLATPHGLTLYAYVWSLGSHPVIRTLTAEWAPPTITDPLALPFFLSLAATFLVIARSRRRLEPTDLLVLLVFALLGLQAIRSMVWWALATAPILAASLTQLPIPRPLVQPSAPHPLLQRLEPVTSARPQAPRQEPTDGSHPLAPNLEPADIIHPPTWSTSPRPQPWSALARAVVLLALVVACLPWLKAHNPLLPPERRPLVSADYPHAALAFLQAQPLPQRVFTEQTWSGYLDWLLWPRYMPMVDDAMEVHPPDVWADVLAINAGHASWEERLSASDVGVLLLSREKQPALIAAAQQSPTWHPLYADAQAIVYTRQP